MPVSVDLLDIEQRGTGDLSRGHAALRERAPVSSKSRETDERASIGDKSPRHSSSMERDQHERVVGYSACGSHPLSK